MKHKVIMQFAHTTIWTHVISISYEDNNTLLGTRILGAMFTLLPIILISKHYLVKTVTLMFVS